MSLSCLGGSRSASIAAPRTFPAPPSQQRLQLRRSASAPRMTYESRPLRHRSNFRRRNAHQSGADRAEDAAQHRGCVAADSGCVCGKHRRPGVEQLFRARAANLHCPARGWHAGLVWWWGSRSWWAITCTDQSRDTRHRGQAADTRKLPRLRAREHGAGMGQFTVRPEFVLGYI